MHILRKWLSSGQDFDEGVKLLESFNGSDTWLNIFKKLGESTYTRVELFKQIEEVMDSIDAIHIPAKNLEYKPEQVTKAKELPLVIKQIEEERKTNFKEANRLHFSLVLHVESVLIKNIEIVDAKTEVYKLRDVWEDIDEAWRITDHHSSTGEIPKQKEIVRANFQIDINHAADRRRTLKSYLSPSYMKRIPEKRRKEFEEITKREIEEIDQLIIENEAVIHLR